MPARRTTLSLLLALCPAFPLAAQVAPQWFATLPAEGAHHQLDVALADGSSARAEIPSTVSIRRVVATGDRYLASGSRVEADRSRPYLARLLAPAGDSGHALQVEELPSPPVRSGWQAGDAEPLVARGELRGAIWLEYRQARGQEVRTARWLGERWSSAETIAPQGRGSQLALTAVALGDGSALVAWSRFDGSDDEIAWARFDGRSWGPPATVTDNQGQPDITPALGLLPGGTPLLAWSQFDGNDYRLQLSRWEADGFAAAITLGGKGAGRPSFVAGRDRLAVEYWDTEADAWVVVELDAEGRPKRRAAFGGGSQQRPRVQLDDAGARFRGLQTKESWLPWQHLP
jgi:hypothetical protein